MTAYTPGDRVRDVSHGWVGTVTDVTDTDIVVEWDDTGDDTPFPTPPFPVIYRGDRLMERVQ